SQLATSLPQQVDSIHQALQPATTLSSTDDETKEPDGGHPGAGVGDVGGGDVAGARGGGDHDDASGAVRGLSPWGGADTAAGLGPAGVGAQTSPTVAPTSAGPRGAVAAPAGGVMPMGAAGAAGTARGGETTAHSLRGQLVTEQHGDEVVGEMGNASLPVVGAVERVTEVSDTDPPDKALTL